MKKIYFICILLFIFNQSIAQVDRKLEHLEPPRFKMIKVMPNEECTGAGVSFEKGYVIAKKEEWVDVMIFFHKRDGSFIKKHYEVHGTGYVDLKTSGCDLTGSYYAFVCYAQDKDCKIPTEQEVRAKHEEIKITQLPQFKITRTLPNKECPNGSTIFESGFLFCPTGGKVEITLFLEKNDGEWRKKHFYHLGTGTVQLNIKDCDLTGNYKIALAYVD